MNTFKKKSLYAALAGVSALGVTGAAQAVSVNPDGLGQALIYPYYTVRDKVEGAPYASLLSVVNSTASAKAVKVRFLEGKNSREVLDFNLYLSKKDVWVAAIIPTASGAGIYTPDNSCTSPTVSASSETPTEFVNFAYTDASADGADPSLDRTREGYVEIIEMGDIISASLAIDVTHVNGVPVDCSAVPVTLAAAAGQFGPGSGGLFGSMTLINVLAGEAYGVDATALEGFSTTAIWAEPGSVDPTLSFVNPKTSIVTSGFQTYVTDWTTSGKAVDPVSAVFMHNNVFNEFNVETGTKSGTDWIVTMPTKRFYVVRGTGDNLDKLFQRNFDGNNGSCDNVGVTIYDREERQRAGELNFSPPRPIQAATLCWEANVITVNGTSVFNSTNERNIPTDFANGWIELNFPLIGTAGSPTAKHVLYGGGSTVFNAATGGTGFVGSTTFNGLPVIGFAAITYNNGEIPGAEGLIQSNYGVDQLHKATRSIVGGTAPASN